MATEGLQGGMQSLRKSMHPCNDLLKKSAALMIEEVLLKAFGCPSQDRKSLCSKMQQWIAGGKYGVSEDDIHATLLTFCRENS